MRQVNPFLYIDAHSCKLFVYRFAFDECEGMSECVLKSSMSVFVC